MSSETDHKDYSIFFVPPPRFLSSRTPLYRRNAYETIFSQPRGSRPIANNIPASTRTVYAPRLNPKTKTLSPGSHVFSKVRVCFCNFPVDAGTKGESSHFRYQFANFAPRAWFGKRTETGIVINLLLEWIAIENLDKPNDVGVLWTKLVIGTVAADDQVAT